MRELRFSRIFILILLFSYSFAAAAFGDGHESRETDFVMVVPGLKDDFSLGRDLDGLKSQLGQAKATPRKLYGLSLNEYRYDKTSYFTTGNPNRPDMDELVLAFFSSDPAVSTKSGIRVGDRIVDVRKRIGPPTEETEDSVTYYDKSSSNQALVLNVNKDGLIESLELWGIE